MPEMGVTMPAEQFNPPHSKTVVRTLHDIGLFKFRVETGPPTTGIEFAV